MSARRRGSRELPPEGGSRTSGIFSSFATLPPASITWKSGTSAYSRNFWPRPRRARGGGGELVLRTQRRCQSEARRGAGFEVLGQTLSTAVPSAPDRRQLQRRARRSLVVGGTCTYQVVHERAICRLALEGHTLQRGKRAEARSRVRGGGHNVQCAAANGDAGRGCASASSVRGGWARGCAWRRWDDGAW